MEFKSIYIVYLMIACSIIVGIKSFIKFYMQSSKRQKYLVKLLHNREIDIFLKEIDEDIDQNKETKYRYQLMIYKASGLIVAGRFEESLDLLNKINMDKLPRELRSVYYYNKISALFYSELIEEAQIMLRENLELLRSKMKSDKEKYQIKKLYAIQEYHTGNFQKSEDIFNKILQHSSNFVANSICNYYLGLIKLKQEDIELSKMYFEKAYDLGQGTFVENRVKDIFEKL